MGSEDMGAEEEPPTPLQTCPFKPVFACPAPLKQALRCLFLMSPAQLKLVVDSIVWAFRHTERNVAETGLDLLTDLLRQVSMNPIHAYLL